VPEAGPPTAGRACYAGSVRFSAWLAVLTALLPASGCHETTGTLLTLHEPSASGGANPGDAGDADGAVGPPLFRPTKDTTWQVQLTGAIDTSFDVDMYELDLFALDATIAKRLHDRGSKVACYVSVGTAESYRADYGSFPVSAVGNALVDYPDERWLDGRNQEVRSLMTARLQLASVSGCDAVSLSGLQAHREDSGFALTRADDLDYARWLIAECHERGLSAGVATSDDLIASLASDANWGSTAECLSNDGCQAWQAFTAANKAVFMIEYGSSSDAPSLCAEAARLGYSLVIKRRALDAFRVGCPNAAAGP
jgi:glycosyl hydrolase family 114